MMLKQTVTRAATAPLYPDVPAGSGDGPVTPPNAGSIGHETRRARSSSS